MHIDVECQEAKPKYHSAYSLKAGVDNHENHLSMLGDAVAQSVERANPGEEDLGPIPAVAALSLLVGSVSV